MIFLIFIPLLLMLFFMKHILFCDGVLAGIFTGVLCGYYLHWHPAICVLIGIGCVVGVHLIAAFKISFIILTFAAAAFYVATTVGMSRSFNLDIVWTVVLAIVVGAAVIGLHYAARCRFMGD